MPTQQQTLALLVSDHRDSVLKRLEAQGTSSITYSPFGYAAARELSTLCAFNGQVREQLLLIYLLGRGYRAFNTALQRFHSPDNLCPFGDGGLNAYAYCLADPVNQVDPSGHMPLDPTSSIFKNLQKFFGSTAKKLNPSIEVTFSKTTQSRSPVTVRPKRRPIKTTNSQEPNQIPRGNNGEPLSSPLSDRFDQNYPNPRANAEYIPKNVKSVAGSGGHSELPPGLSRVPSTWSQPPTYSNNFPSGHRQGSPTHMGMIRTTTSPNLPW